LGPLASAGYTVNVFNANSFDPNADSKLVYVFVAAEPTAMPHNFDLRDLPPSVVTSNTQVASVAAFVIDVRQ